MGDLYNPTYAYMGNATAQALIGLLVASILLGVATSPVEDGLYEVVPERVEAHELIEAPPAKKAVAAKTAKKSVIKRKNLQKVAMMKQAEKLKAKATPMTCIQRKQEALRTLMNYNAAKTLGAAATEFAVEDTASKWRLKQW